LNQGFADSFGQFPAAVRFADKIYALLLERARFIYI